MILERYIHREILEKVLWILLLLVLILASNRFVQYLADAAAGDLPANLIIQMLAMKMLATLPRMLPLVFFVAVMLALSRMARDRELSVVTGAGIGSGFRFATVGRFAAGCGLVVAAIAFYASPWAEVQMRELKKRASVEADIAGIAAGQFREFSEGERVVYVEQLSEDRQTMKNVFLQVRQDNHLGVLTSDDAGFRIEERTGSHYVVFRNGRRYVGNPGQADYQITEYRKYAVLLDSTPGGPFYETLESIPTGRLIGSKVPGEKAEFQWRLSHVIASILLPLLGVAMTRFAFTEQRYTPVFMAVFIYFVYSNLLGISKTLLKRDQIPAFIGLWWVHLVMVAVIVMVIILPDLWRRFRRRRPAAS